MKIHVVPFAKAIAETEIKDKTVIIIDVLRATSVMITALSNGAREIIPALTIEESNKLANKFNNKNVLLCGEREAKKIDGFDLGNSPLEFTPGKVGKKTLILTTSNGTKALNACQNAKEVLLASFLNVEAVAEKVKHLDELVLVCSGTNGKFSLDDGMCAALIIEQLAKCKTVKTDDLGEILFESWRRSDKNLTNILKNCFHLNYLLNNGYKKDVDYCLQLNSHNIVPVFKKGKITLL